MRTEVLVVGAGPAGIAAATAAAEGGKSTLVLDDNFRAGGQIWRASTTPTSSAVHPKDTVRSRAIERLERSGARLLTNYRVFDAAAPGTLQALHETTFGSSVDSFHYDKLILATGARERFLPFPGWTMPGIFGAGGLQALVRSGYQVRGKRIVVAGTGPLLLAVAAHLAEDGASVSCIVEQAETVQLARFSSSLWSHPAKLMQGVRYRSKVWRAPYHTGCWVTEALGKDDGFGRQILCAVRITNGKQTWEEPCDLLACGYHLVPNTELASLLGCALDSGVVPVDNDQRTSVPNIFCAGEPTGIAGLDAALIQGEIAGLVCAGRPVPPSLRKHAHAEKRFGSRLEKAFALRPELQSLATQETIVCRCEDVPFSSLQGHTSWTDAKLQTRCGMGPCQGRVCGPAVEFLLGWKPASVRQPLFPVPLDALASNVEESEFS